MDQPEIEDDGFVTVAAQEASKRPFVAIRIDGGADARVAKLADLLCAILVDSSSHVTQQESNPPHYVTGRVDDSTLAFIGKLQHYEAEIAEYKAVIEELEQGINEERAARRQAQQIADVLERRYGELAGRKLALHVAHGDVSPEMYETRRRAEVEGIRNLVAAVRQNQATG